jgi:diacylglycerol kinase (ATP)
METTPEDPGQGLTRSALREGVDVVMVCGGDGTVTACATVLAGTGNLLANNLRIPSDLDGAIDVALHGDRIQIDVGALRAPERAGS